jgi:hypothetical protein
VMRLSDTRFMGTDFGVGGELSAIVVADLLANGTVCLVHSETFEVPSHMDFDAYVARVADRFRHDDMADAVAYAFGSVAFGLAKKVAKKLAGKLTSLKSKARAQRRLDLSSRVRRKRRREELARRRRG